MNNQENVSDVFYSLKDIREKRRKQYTAERIIEALTGLSADESEFVGRIKKDKQIIRLKYNLPPEEMRKENPREYYSNLLQIANKNGLKIKSKKYDEQFFKENPDANAKFEVDTMTIVFDLNEENEKLFSKSLIEFEHELIHGLQIISYPRMPIEVMEYEAYVASAPISLIKNSSPGLRSAIFGGSLSTSVLDWYRRQGVEAYWDNPEWFLKNIDKVDLEESDE